MKFQGVETGEIWSSCAWMSMSLPRFGKFSATTSLNSFLSFSLSSSGTPRMQIWSHLMVSPKSHKLSSFLFILFFLFSLLIGWFQVICSRVHWYCLLPDQFCSWNFPLPFFFFSLVIVFFSVTLSVWFFLIFYLCWTLHSVLVLFSWFCSMFSHSSLSFFIIFLLFWLYHATCGILIAQPGVEPTYPALEVAS